MTTSLTEAIAYCERRRAFMIIDAPETVATFDAGAGVDRQRPASPLRSRNVGALLPAPARARPADEQRASRSFPAAGALAGLFARTDAERGVWKAPAGTARDDLPARPGSRTR